MLARLVKPPSVTIPMIRALPWRAPSQAGPVFVHASTCSFIQREIHNLASVF